MTVFGINATVKINGNVADFSPDELVIVMKDSVHKLLPTAQLIFQDPTGYLKEAGLLTDGLTYEIELVDPNNVSIKVPFVVESGEVGRNIQLGTVGHPVNLTLEHEFLVKQTALSDSHDDTVSNVVKALLSSASFTSLDIESTTGQDRFIVPGVLPLDYIECGLLPLAWSSNCSDTPFVAFADLTNKFFFKSLKSLWSAGSAATLVYGPQPMSSTNTKFDPLVLYDVSPFTNGVRKTQPTWKSSRAALQEKDLTFDAVTDSTYQHILDNNKVPILTPNSDPTSYVFDGRVRNQGQDDANLLKGKRNRLSYPTFFQERMIATGPFNPTLTAGKRITLKTYLPQTGNSNTRQQGSYYAADWLIESSIHALYGDTKQSFSSFILARKTAKFVNGSALDSLAISS